MRYRLIGIDLDGTLLRRDGSVSQANLDAIYRAQLEGVLVVPCTGRSWKESHRPMEAIADLSLGIFVTGAMIAEIHGGQSLDCAALSPKVAQRAVEIMADSPEAVLMFRDAAMAGHDYLVTGKGILTANTAWWFESNGLSVAHEPVLSEEHFDHTLRVGMVAGADRMEVILPRLRNELGDQIVSHHFSAIQVPGQNEATFVLEIFAAGVDKWRGIQWVAQQHGLMDSEIVVIGDEINDIPMMKNAGCGIAMGNAIELLKQQAKYVTKTNDQDGVAYAIHQLLDGKWG